MIKRKACILLSILVIMVFTGCDFLHPSVEVVESDENTAPIEVRMLDVGQGLCLVIKADDHYLIYDGGGRKSATYVAGYMRENNIRKAEYVVSSHYDEDHLSGLIAILNVVKAENILTAGYECDNKVYSMFRKAVSDSGSAEIHPAAGDEYELGDAHIQILGPESYDAEYENNRSVAMRISYGDFSVMITGDAEYEEELYIIENFEDIRSTIYVAGHHGGSYSSSSGFLNAVLPDYAFISAGRDNRFGHPSEYTIERLESDHIRIYRTDMDGGVTAYSNGQKMWFETGMKLNRNKDRKYVLNTRTKTIHEPSCRWVSEMSSYNTVYTDDKRNKLLKEGYDLCGYCNP